MEIFVWIVTGSLMLLGLAGVIVPLLPGTALILGAAVLHKVLLPEAVAWSVIGRLGVIWLVSVAADFGGVLLGDRKSVV